MFAALRKAAKQISSGSMRDDGVPEVPSQGLPEKYSFSQIFDEINTIIPGSSQEVAFQTLFLLYSCLSHAERLQRNDGEGDTILELLLWTAKSMLPDGNTILNDKQPEGDISEVVRASAVDLARYKGILGLSCLKILLQDPSAKGSSQLDSTILISIIAFTVPRDPWTTPAAKKIAESLLSAHCIEVQSEKFVVYVLHVFIRPLFSKSKPDTITSAGRKAMPSSAPPKRHDVTASDRASKPWKYESPYSVAVFAWLAKVASQEIITAHWNMFIPPLLTLLDTPTANILVSGLETLTAFLPKFSTKLLQQTGLGEVFEDAVMPTLLYLPSISPVEESVEILPAAFEALFVSCDVRYPPSTSSTDATTSASRSLSLVTLNSKTSSTKTNTPDQRLALLDRVMRKGILMAHLHASDLPQITTILLTATSTLVSKMGINCVKHLKDILPILTEVMTDPFGAFRPEGLREAVKCLTSVILNAWPRMGIRSGGHGMEVIRMLAVCWGIVKEGVQEQARWAEDKKAKAILKVLREVEGELPVVGRLLVKALEAVNSGTDVKQELKPLLSVNASLADVFGIDDDDNKSKG
ncbi:uncharacterized protein PAC_13187 [Phialocephala subalpina]|uniref:Uncharacterized protein n=1 Tax=Phialocephala subalpina TaxID=576137 RepID=A0A1L7XE21_9HELO|nr:uncharacterized protein PAC_13187 [Phialocephala subalpina]